MTVDNFIRQYYDIFPSELFIEDLIKLNDNQESFSRTFRSSSYRTDTAITLELEPYWPKIVDNINEWMIQKCLIPYFNDFPFLRYQTNWTSGCTILQKTKPMQGYHQWHCEDIGWREGSRTLAWMIYLNDVEEGGETEFLYQQLKIKPKKNTALIWPGSFTHLHRGNPPFSGNKYILTGWYSSVDSMNTFKIPENNKEKLK